MATKPFTDNIIRRIVISALLLLSLASCSRYPASVRKVLRQAGDNRAELEAALDHFAADSAKYAAVSFLISSMPGKHSMEGKSLDDYYAALETFYARDSVEVLGYYAFLDSLFKKNRLADLQRVEDSRSVSSDYLIKRVEDAFAVRGNRYLQDTSFDGFCEYVLPYRIGTEVLEDWQSDYSGYFSHFVNWAAEDTSYTLKAFCDSINILIGESHKGYDKYPAGMPTAKPSSLKRILGGSCMDYLVVFVTLARTVGLPVAIDYTPQWANHSQGHTWGEIIQKDSCFHYCIGEMMRYTRNKTFAYRLAKAYRQTYSGQPDEREIARLGRRGIPPGLSRTGDIDVTGEYVDVSELTVRHLLPQGRTRYVTLSCFNDSEWVGVAVSRRRFGTVTFPDLGYPAVYLPQYYSGGRYIPASSPVLLDSGGVVRELRPYRDSLCSVVLKRKFMDTRALQFVEKIKGGHFELSDNPEFGNCLTLPVPDTVGYNFQTIDVQSERRFRYCRFIPREGSGGDIAEMELYGKDGSRLDGSVIGNYAGDKTHGMEKAFDGNTLTYTFAGKGQTGAWIGWKLDKASAVGTIVYLPRSDDNFIREGEAYELYYWDEGRWNSLGRRTGRRATQELRYNNVPAGALLLLRNHTKGKEERIFTYEDGKQVWW